MNKYDSNLVERLESMAIDEARKAIAAKEFGDIGSENHSFCSSWLAVKESEDRDKREKTILAWSVVSAIAAICAAAISLVGLLL